MAKDPENEEEVEDISPPGSKVCREPARQLLCMLRVHSHLSLYL